jgi:hypothetical protein
MERTHLTGVTPSFLLIALIFLTGCATTQSQDFWQGLKAKRGDNAYFHGRYIGTEKDCFPPITNRQCVPLQKAETLYEASRQLEMESFSFSMSSDFFGQSEVKDKLYFAASELALSRGYKMFTVTTMFDITTCRDGIESTTRGTFTPGIAGQGGTYSGSTSVRPSGQCLISQGIQVIYFKDKEDFAKGVLTRSTTGQSQWLYPETSLYYGTIPNLRHDDLNRQSLPGAFTRTVENAWKVHYDAEGLSADFRKKYKVAAPPQVTFVDEAQGNATRQAEDPLQRNRISTP